MKLMCVFFVVFVMCGSVLCAGAEKEMNKEKKQKRAFRTGAEPDVSSDGDRVAGPGDREEDPVSNLQLLVPMVVVDDGIINPGRAENQQDGVLYDGDDDSDEGNLRVVVLNDRNNDDDDGNRRLMVLNDNDDDSDEGNPRVVMLNDRVDDSNDETARIVVMIDEDDDSGVGNSRVVMLNDGDNDSDEENPRVVVLNDRDADSKDGNLKVVLLNDGDESDSSVNIEAAGKQFDISKDQLKAWYSARHPQPTTQPPLAAATASPGWLVAAHAVSSGQHDANTCPVCYVSKGMKLNLENQKDVGQSRGQWSIRVKTRGSNHGQKDQSLDSARILQLLQKLVAGDQRVKQADHRIKKKGQSQNTIRDQVDQWMDNLAQIYSQQDQSMNERIQVPGWDEIENKAWDNAGRKWKHILHRDEDEETWNPKHEKLNWNQANQVWGLTDQAWQELINRANQQKQRKQDSVWEKFAQIWEQADQSSDQSDRSYQKDQQRLNQRHQKVHDLLSRRSSNGPGNGPPQELPAPQKKGPTP
ncbi:hypothetical protein O0L34_g18944 [Tuta absoluta]|nr:hypothetical protein O0L34_g18944 [Tuta absoluta]